MKIGIDCRLYSSKFTGIGRYTHSLVENLIQINKKNGYPHEFILFFNNPEYSEYKPEKNVTKILANAKHYTFAEQFHFYRKLKKENLDLMFFTHFNVPILYRKKYIVTVHDLTLSIFPGQKMTKWYHRLAYNLVIKNAVKKAKKVIAVSQNTKDDIIKFLKISGEKIAVVHNGIGDEFTFIREAHLFSHTLGKFKIKKEFILYTGLWRSHKNLVRLLEAFNILRKNDLDLQFVITGNPDPYYPEIKETVKDLHLENDVIFTNLVEDKDLVNLYNAALIFAFPSLYEGFGYPPLEAMKCGTPVAASNTSSVPEICGDAALYFNPLDTEDIANKITQVYKSAELQADMVEKGLKRASEFTLEKMADETYKIITNV